MKKIFFFLIMLLGFQSYAQKTIYIYNLSSTNFDIGSIDTGDVDNDYPTFESDLLGDLISIAPNTIYIITTNPVSPTKFPFLSPSSPSPINFWSRKLSATSPAATLPSNVVDAVYGASQVLKRFKFQLGPNGMYGGNSFFPSSYESFSGIFYFTGTLTVTFDMVDSATASPSDEGETYIIITGNPG